MAILNGTFATDNLDGTELNDTINGLAGDDVLSGLGGADQLYGGAGDDELYGGDGADTLHGDSGYDFLVGGKGNDVLDGGTTTDPGAPSWWSDIDTVSYNEERGSKGVNVNLATGVATDSFGNTDTLIDIERVYGTAFKDILKGGNPANDSIEIFGGLAGADRINGGSGWDIVEYYWDRDEGGKGGIVANLALGTIRDGFGDVDTVLNIEEVRGTAFADELRGSSGDDWFNPFGGNDYINGRGGSDTVSYSIDGYRGGHAGIQADLNTGIIFDTDGWMDTLISIENVRGSDFDDRILGKSGRNYLDGGDGADILKGRSGNDVLYGAWGADALFGGANNDWLEGGSGNDVLRGGDGYDTFYFDADSDQDTIRDFKTGIDRIDVSSFGFASKSAVLANLHVISSGFAELDLGGDTYVLFANVDTNHTFLAAGDIII